MRHLRLALLVGLAMLASACSSTWKLEHAAPAAVLPPEVDSVVVQPFEKAPQVEINAADLALFAKHLRGALDARESLRAFDEPPTLLPNTVLLAGRLERYAVTERQGEGLYLRTIELDATLRVLPPQGETQQVETRQVETPQPEKPQTVLRRAVSWQKAYAGAPVSGLALDLEDAVGELGRQFAQTLVPIPQQGVLVLRDGRDAHSGSGEANPGLVKGNRFAVAGHLDRATLAWQQVLFDPALKGDGRAYQITAQTVNQLRAAGVPEDALERLKPLVGESPLPLVAFRRRVRGAAGEVLPNEGLILTLADAQAGRAHRSLAAAHVNLALVFGLEARDDVAAYHWAHAWAHDPDPALLERWQALQAKRKVLPGALTGPQAMALYLRIPPPSTARVVPGRFERTVVPAPAFAEPAPQNTGGSAGAGGASAGAAVSAATDSAATDSAATDSAATDSAAAAAAPSAPGALGAPAGPQPVALPPPGTSEDSTPGRAAGSGPRAAEGPPSEAPPAPASAPASQ